MFGAVAVVVALTIGVGAPPAAAHGGDGQRASCPVGNPRVASWGCGNAFVFGDTIYAYAADLDNDGHCVYLRAATTTGRTYAFQRAACNLGQLTDLTVSSIAPHGEWNRVWILNGHRWMTLCGAGSGREC